MQAAAKETSSNGTSPRAARSIPQDILSGFLVFLIAMPLCLGISVASGYPPIAGVFTAIIGGVLTTFISNSQLTIKGPAAGLIVIAIGCVADFGPEGTIGTTAADGTWTPLAADASEAYRMALAVGVAAAVFQILFGLFRAGILGEFFPTSAVHGMLAAIGVIIIAKQFPIALGLSSAGEPLHLLAKIPDEIIHMNPEIAIIGGISLLILFGLPFIKNRYVKMIPAQMVVVLVAVPLGMWLELDHTHTYNLWGNTYEINEKSHLVDVPDNMFKALRFPNFEALMYPAAWKWVFMFAAIGTLESMLSAKAIDSLDPWKRKTNLDRDNLAVGIANLVSASIGGLPMISEIVRSKANIDNGARTRFADMYHGLFLLGFVASVPFLIHRIPMAALGAMLVYTGFRLASPREFANVYMVGREQLVVFITTIVAVLATDLLIGIGIGIGVKFMIHFMNGLPLGSVFKPSVTVEERDERTTVIRVREAAVFTNWIPLRWRINRVNPAKDIIIDFSETLLIDHTVMEKLHELEREFAQNHRLLEVIGLHEHAAFSAHPQAARRKSPVSNNGAASGNGHAAKASDGEITLKEAAAAITADSTSASSK
jgi:MFS superfamily sulfate permease-like transporter